MMDFNFFQPYIITKQDKLSKRELILYIFIGFIVVGTIIFPIVNQLIIRDIENETSLVLNTIEYEEIQKHMEEIDNLQIQIKEIEEYYNILESIDNEFKKIDIINDFLINTITDRVPEGVFFDNMNMDGNRARISALAKNSEDIARFQQSLKEINYLENVFISNISINTGIYMFTISFEVKGENYNGTN